MNLQGEKTGHEEIMRKQKKRQSGSPDNVSAVRSTKGALEPRRLLQDQTFRPYVYVGVGTTEMNSQTKKEFGSKTPSFKADIGKTVKIVVAQMASDQMGGALNVPEFGKPRD